MKDWWTRLSRGGRIAVIVGGVLLFGLIGSAFGLGEAEEEAGDPPGPAATTTTVADEAPGGTTTTVPDDPSVFVPDLEAGDCIDEVSAEAFSVPIVDCTEPHAFEVTGFHDLEGDDDRYPTEAEMAGAAEGPCAAAFAEHVGTTTEASDLSSLPFLFPTEAGWTDGNRQVVCVAHADDGTLLELAIEDRD